MDGGFGQYNRCQWSGNLLSVMTIRVSLSDGGLSVLDQGGRASVIHTNEDLFCDEDKVNSTQVAPVEPGMPLELLSLCNSGSMDK